MYIQTIAERCLASSDEHYRIIKEFSEAENIIFNCKSKQCYMPNRAENLSFKFTFKGKEHYQYGNNNVNVVPANFLVINEGQEHSSWIESETWVESFAIYLTPHFVREVVQDGLIGEDVLIDNIGLINGSEKLNFLQTLLTFNPEFYNKVGRFKYLLEQTQGEDSMMVDESLRIMLSDFIQLYKSQVVKKINDVDAVKLSTRVEIVKRVNMAKDFIESYYTNDISLKDISEVSFLSENMLLRHFKKIFQTTPYQYITQKRLEFAKELLSSSDIPVNRITTATGFQSASSFGRVFKSTYGVTPETFRREVLV